MELTVPSSLGLRDLFEFTRKLDELPPEGSVTLDFGRMGHAGPFALLFISTKINQLRHAKPGLKIHPRHYSQHSYFAHMGFFRACGIEFGKEPGAAAGSERYVSITRNGVNTLRQESRESGRPIGELVEEEARTLAQILSQTRTGPVFDTLTFALREIMRNTFEHSRAPGVEYCAQYWPSIDRVEIAVLDRGIGIYKSLLRNETLKISSEKHALNMALLPGISCNVPLQGEVTITGNVWQNSGFGLFMTQRMCRLGGEFLIGSGEFARVLKGDYSRYVNFGFGGTAVRLVLKPSSIGNLNAALSQFEREAKSIARENNIRIPDASTASRRVRLDFSDLPSE
jgi:hypothetical protein